MKTSKTIIPLKLREELAADPVYSTCMLFGQDGHVCEGSITWEHAIRYAGKSYQKKWAIVPICEKGHAVNKFQDAGTMSKEINQWVALNRATDAELREISKAENYFQTKKYLNSLYGEYFYKIKPKFPLPAPTGVPVPGGVQLQLI